MRCSQLIPAFVIGLAIAGTAQAAYYGASPLIPPLDGVYVTPVNSATTYPLYGGTMSVVLQNVIQENFTNIQYSSISGGTRETFDSSVMGMVSLNGGTPVPVTLTGSSVVDILNNYRQDDTGTFATTMIQLNLSGVTGVYPLNIRVDPNKTSTGQTTITDIGGGEYKIDSFFDIFTEISFDYGNSWTPATSSTHVDLMPEPASLGMLSLGALLLLRRRGL
jgi:hypothetical protein